MRRHFAGREIKVIVLSLPWNIFFLRVLLLSSVFYVQLNFRLIHSEFEAETAIHTGHAHTNSIVSFTLMSVHPRCENLSNSWMTYKTKRTKSQRPLNNHQTPAQNETRQSITGSYTEVSPHCRQMHTSHHTIRFFVV